MQSCSGYSGLVKAAVEVEMPLAVNTFSSPHAVPLRWEAFTLLQVTHHKAELPGSVLFILKYSEIVSEEPTNYSLANLSRIFYLV